MKKYLLLILLILYAFALVGCGSDIHSREMSDYMSWNADTIQLLNSNFSQSLPDELTAAKYGVNYYYTYSQGTFGDPNFVIYLELAFPDEEEFNEYLGGLGISQITCIQVREAKYYLIQGTEEHFAEYINAKTYDGWFFDFEVISTNESSNRISYIFAHVWDYWQNDKLLELIELICNR